MEIFAVFYYAGLIPGARFNRPAYSDAISGRKMKTKRDQLWIDDFSEFCKTVDVKSLVASADEEGNAPGQHKQLYAIAIVRALHYGKLGSDWYDAQSSVSMLWELGNNSGFSTESFNTGLRKLTNHRRMTRPGFLDGPVDVFSRAVHGR